MNINEIKKRPLLLTVKQVENDGSKPVLANGTKFFVGDQEVKGIRSIKIFGEVDKFWRAEIDCFVSIGEITCLAKINNET